MKWYRVGIFAAGGETPSDFAVGDFTLGRNADRLGIHWITRDGGVYALGDQAIKLCAQLDLCIFWDWIDSSIIQRIRQWSMIGTKIAFALEYECVPARPRKLEAQEVMRKVSLAHKLKPTRTNTDGNDFVDPYEGLDRHAVYIEVENPHYATRYLDVLEAVLQTRYRYARPDFGFVDSLLDSPYHGRATNAPNRVPGEYALQYRNFVTRYVSRVGPLAGNTNGGAGFPLVRWRYEEHVKWDAVRPPVATDSIHILGTLRAEPKLPTFTDGRTAAGVVLARSGSLVHFPDGV